MAGGEGRKQPMIVLVNTAEKDASGSPENQQEIWPAVEVDSLVGCRFGLIDLPNFEDRKSRMNEPAGGPQSKPQRCIGLRGDVAQRERVKGVELRRDQTLLVSPFERCHVRQVQVACICELRPQERRKGRSQVVKIPRRGGVAGKEGEGELSKVIISDEAADHGILEREGLLESLMQVVAIDLQTGGRIDTVGADPRNDGSRLILEQMRRERALDVTQRQHGRAPRSSRLSRLLLEVFPEREYPRPTR